MRKAKLALLAFLSTVITVGGVYATWTFSQGPTTGANTTVNVAMTGVNSETEKGTLSVTVMGAGGFTLSVDDSNNDHYPEIKKEGVITITFTPSPTASDDIKTKGIDVQCVLSYAPYENGPATLADWKYPATNEGVQIFEIQQPTILLEKEDATNVNGVFTWEIGKDDLSLNLVDIDLTDAFKGTLIDTLDKYNAVNTELAKGHFVLTVSEYTTSSNP